MVRRECDDGDVEDVLPADAGEEIPPFSSQMAPATLSPRAVVRTLGTRTTRAPPSTARSEAMIDASTLSPTGAPRSFPRKDFRETPITTGGSILASAGTAA